MFDFIGVSRWVPIVLVVLACVAAGIVPVLLQKIPKGAINDAWRDRAPMAFRLLRPLIRLYAARVAAAMSSHQAALVQERLNAAGMAYTMKPEEFVLMRWLGLLVGVGILIYVYLLLPSLSWTSLIGISLIVPAAYIYPDLWLRDETKRRQALLEKQFPFFLDLLVLSMLAGLNFTSAVQHAVESLTEGPVKKEFGRFLRDVRTGIGRKEALSRLAKRVQLPSVKSFTSAVIQAEETGAMLSEVLAQQAKQRRAERFIRAEKLANQAPVKLLGPLIGLLFPITFVIIGFPLAIQLSKAGLLDLF